MTSAVVFQFYLFVYIYEILAVDSYCKL